MNINKIKIEPGTSKLTNVLKFEEGRLPSLSSHNLKLGGTKTKIFKPNLVERKKKNDVISNEVTNANHKGRGRGRGSDRGRGTPRGRGAQNFIQSQGVFSEGMSEAQKKNHFFSDRSHSSKDNDASKMMDKPVFNRSTDYKFDKEHEDDVMKQLHDDFIDYGKTIINEIFPVDLPVISSRKKQLAKDKKIIKVKIDPDSPDSPDDEKEVEVLVNDTSDDVKLEPKIENSLFDTQEKLLLFQFPDCLPGIGPVDEPDKSQNTSDNSSDKTLVRNNCTLKDINEGQIGKILIYKSGKRKLVIGNTIFDIDEGFKPGFLQDVISVNANVSTKSGDMINLGSVEDSIVITPQFEDLLKT